MPPEAANGAQNPAPHARKHPGRPATYTDEIGEEICARIIEGEPLTSICRDKHMPSLRTVCRWAAQPDDGVGGASGGTFWRGYARARLLRADTWGEQLITIADNASTSKGGVNKARLQSDNRKWLMARTNPATWGDRVTAVLEGGEKPIQTNDVAMLELARWLAFKLQAGADISDSTKLLEAQAHDRSDVGQNVGQGGE